MQIEIPIEEPIIKVLTDIPFSNVPAYFGELMRGLTLDLMIPLDQTLPKRPLLIWIIGGGWKQINKDKFLAELTPYAKHGYAVASIEYRVSGEDIFPAQIVDVKAAIRFLRANADRFRLDPDHFFVMGESAGGHLAALAAATGTKTDWDQGAYTDYSSKVQGCVDLYGICDFEDQPLYPAPFLFQDFAPEEFLVGGKIANHRELAKQMNPLTFADENTPPFLIFHGLSDQIVPHEQSEKLYQGLIGKGIDAQLYLIRDANHADPRFYQAATRKIIFDFLDGLCKEQQNNR